MTSGAAIEGVKAYGLAWKASINLRGQTERLADEDSLKIGDCLVIRDSIARSVREFLNSRAARVLDMIGRDAIAGSIDGLEQCGDDPDELREALQWLYDQFDFFRICMVG